MDPDKARALRICAPMIIQSLEPDSILDHLYSKGWVSLNEVELVGLEKTNQNKSRKVLELIRSRPTSAFDDFLVALDSEGSFLAAEIRKHIAPSPFKKKEHSLSDLRELLLEGAVPDKPSRYINRPDLVNILSNKLRALADHFRVEELPINKLAEVDITPKFKTYSKGVADFNPPPTNAWLLIHGPPGSGKSVLSASVLRQESALLMDCFPGGVVWMHVGQLRTINSNCDTVSFANQNIIQLIDRLEYRVNQLSDHSCIDTNQHTTGSHNFPVPSSSTLDESLERLRKALIRRQQRVSWGPDKNGSLITLLLLIVLDDVWDVEVGRVLSNLPGAFVVTSRDSDVLERLETPVDKLHLHDDLSEDEIASLLSMWTGYSPELFIPSSKSSQGVTDSEIFLSTLGQMTHGSPFAVSLLGSLLYNQFHRLSDFIFNNNGSGYKYLDWVSIKRPSAYGYDSVYQAFERSLSLLSTENQAYYRRLVIFDPGIVLTPKVCGILWAVPVEKAEAILSVYTRYSLAARHWISKVGSCGYTVHGLQLDLLKSSVGPAEQANYHGKFIKNYSTFCGGRWLKLVSSWEHTYFWNYATEHLFKAGQLDKLVDMLINLDFLRGRLKIIGTTPVIADFQRYRAVFATLNRMAEWLAYLRFIQTNAYYIIDPTVVQDCDRSRSPCQGSRRGSVVNLDLSPPNFRPDSRCISPVDSRRCSFSHRTKTNSMNVFNRSDFTSPTTATPTTTTTTGPKGIDLLQLGLGLSQDNPVFQQAIQLLTQRYQTALKMRQSSKETAKSLSIVRAFKYYWFWCNSHIAASQLLWAIPTGSQGVTCLAVELPYSTGTEKLTNTSKVENPEGSLDGLNYLYLNSRYRKRYLASTSDGRVLLLDANSGYEVALHQVYPPDTEVKFLNFLSNNTECLTCGSNGSVVISTLPVAEEIPGEDFYPLDETLSDEEIDKLPNDYYLHHRGSCDLDAKGNDDDEISIYGLTDSKENGRYPISEGVNFHLEPDDSEISASATIRRQKHADISSPVYGSPPVDVFTPTVLAELPQLTEIARVDGAQNIPSCIISQPNETLDSTYQLQCIAANPTVDLLVMAGEGCLDSVSHRADGINSTACLKTTPKLPSVYHLKRGGGGKLRLDCSRELRLPHLSSEHWYSQLLTDSNPKVHITTISQDGNLIAVCLSDGFIWVYNLDEICWTSCISTKLAGDFVTKFWSQRFSVDIFDDNVESQLFDPELLIPGVGPAASCAIFLPPFINTDNPIETDKVPVFFAASLSTQVMVWCLPDNVNQTCESEILEKKTLASNSLPRLHLSCSCASTVLSMDARIIEGQCILAGGTASGRVLIWRIRDGYKLVELSVHASWVTAIRLLPDEYNTSASDIYFDYNTNRRNCLPIGLLTASVDGVIKRWDVGTAFLPPPSTPTPTGPVWPISSGTSSHRDSHSSAIQNPTALHGLWTEVFSVWFGENGSLLVVGRRRHSTDLQFLFRPKQLNDSDDVTCSFQEISIKPSQSSYWNPSVQTNEAEPLETNSSESKTVQKSPRRSNHRSCSSSENPRKLLPSKHWILTTGLPSLLFGTITAVSFWNGGYWVAVGFSSGNVIVYSLHYDDSKLYGIVKRYHLLACEPDKNKSNGELNKQRSSSSFEPSDHILHLHTFPSSDHLEANIVENNKFLLVVGVYKSGCVKAWYLFDVCHTISDPNVSCVNVYPSECWSKLHYSSDFSNGTVVSQNANTNLQSEHLNDSSSNDSSIITWSTCRLIERSQHPLMHDYRKHGAQQKSLFSIKGNQMLVWFTAGRDGRVFGRELCPPNNELESDPKGTCWRLDLDAHVPMTVTDADIESSGQWLVTGSTDQTAKVWFLPSGIMAFDTGKHPMCVRSVAFRPTINKSMSNLDEEQILVTGDDEGTLRVWRLTTQILCNQVGYYYSTLQSEKNLYSGRALSPDVHRFNNSLAVGGDHVRRSAVRIPSPDPLQNFSARGDHPRDNRFLPKRPDFYSTAAGYGSTWLHKLAWSPDGRLLAGLSDRICVWPFESTQQADSSTGDSDDSSPESTFSPINSTRRVSVPHKAINVNLPKFEVQQCRVLRVLSSGACSVTGRSPPLMISSSRRLVTNFGDKSYDPLSSIDLPPTVVTVDSNTGTLYIFDPVGCLFKSTV
ncbi:unnamed protein product [Trichobilharzia szidati]|nr:unnamed protein product [Trichobilharzia szidati]